MPETPISTKINEGSAADAALLYLELGIEPIPLLTRGKSPAIDWGTIRQWSPEEIAEHFGTKSNVGAALGERSGGLVDLDFDTPEAVPVADVIFARAVAMGRVDSPRSHRFVRCSSIRTKRFQVSAKAARKLGLDRQTILEVRGDGGQTMVAPSIHPKGEKVIWHGDPSKIPTIDHDELHRLAGLCATLALVLRFYPRVEGDRDNVCLALTGTLVRAALSDDQIDRLVQAIATAAGDDEAEKRVGKAEATRMRIEAGETAWGLPELCDRLGIQELEPTFRKWMGMGKTSGVDFTGRKPNGSPTILVEQGNLPYEVDQAENALITGNAGVYQRGNQLVRVSKIPKQVSEDGVERPGGALVLTKVISPWLREQFARCANWEKPVKEGTKPINPPFEHAAAYIARVGEWRVPVLNGIIATPTLRADGSILQEPGFDFESGLLYDPRGVEYAPVPEAPSRDQAVEALDVLMRPFREFPFADGVAKSVLITAALTALIRRSLPTAPMFAVDAPTAGSGKTYIAQTIGIIATGHIPTLIAQGKSDEEDEKRISTVLIAGDPIVVVDNCERAISGDALCGVLTTETWGARILGKSELAKVPTNTLFMATGNNLVVAGDMARRILVCRLDPRMENPEQAEYDFDPRTEAAEHRTEIVAAGLTILRAFITAGRPKQSKPLGSFNEWNLVRDAVIWLGLPDPAITVERNKVDDPMKSELSNLLELWVAALGEKEVGLADIGIEAEQSRSPQINELHQALASMTRNGQFNTKSIGRLLRKHIDRIVNGRALRKNSGPSGSLLYRVEILDRQKLTDADDSEDETEFPF